MREPSYTLNEFAYASCTAITTAPKADVIAAVKEWADDLGWVLANGSDPFSEFLTFDATRHSSLWLSLQMDVAVSTKGRGRSGVAFTASMFSVRPVAAELERAVASFAAGVCQELRERGHEVSPTDLGKRRQKRSRLRRFERSRRSAYRLLLMAAVPVLAVAAIFTYRNLWVLLIIAMWLTVLQIGLMYFRWRILGMRMRFLRFYVLFSILVALGGTFAVIADEIWP